MSIFREPQELAGSLGELLSSNDYLGNSPFSEEDNLRIADWLYIAAGLKSVLLDRARLLPGFGYYRGADHFELARDDLLTIAVSELTRFLFCWGALETTVDLINPPPDTDRRGKINAACSLIRKHFGDSPVAGVSEVLEALRRSLQTWHAPDDLLIRFNRTTEYGLAAVGLHAVYGLRNHLVHGSLRFPELPEQAGIVESIRLGMSLTLVSLQTLFAAAFPDLQCTPSLVSGVPFDECDFQLILRYLHLKEDAWPQELDT